LTPALRDLIKDPTAAELELVARYAMLPENPARERAFTAFATSGLPHRRMEQWKWTDFKAALKTVEQVKSKPNADPFAGIKGHTISFDGVTATIGKMPKGVRVIERADPIAVTGAEDQPMAALTAAVSGTAGGPSMLLIEVTETVSAPLKLTYTGAGRELTAGRIKIVIRENASLTLIESHMGDAGLTTSLLEADIKAGGSLTRALYQVGGKNEAEAITAQIVLGEGAKFHQTTLAFGAKLARIETRVEHTGKHAEAVMNTAYLAAKDRHVDITTYVRHSDTDCVTRQTTKGAVRAGGRGVFQGKFFVPRTVGQRTDADMQHNALLLEEGAEVFAKPELEIYADDVECAHGNTSGQMDANQLFYMRQRGIPEAQAKALLTEAFIAEALKDVDEAVSEPLLEMARNWLQGAG